ncbi:MAG TPA: CGNR zinc finger domain-containing protein [Chloroflexota bacterium]|nr:CGNR zinc finger domain-containing protein [Chloroflexota bacterium]
MVDESDSKAPGALRRIQAFINSEDLENRTDDLRTPDALRSWLVEWGVLAETEPTGANDVALARRVRAALRDLAFANNHGTASPESWDFLNRAAADAGVHIRLAPDGGQLVTTLGGVPGAMGRLLADVYEAMQAGTWQRLKACRDDTCRWVFYDRSKNRSGAWCSMAECGNRAKTRAYRRRSRPAMPA